MNSPRMRKGLIWLCTIELLVLFVPDHSSNGCYYRVFHDYNNLLLKICYTVPGLLGGIDPTPESHPGLLYPGVGATSAFQDYLFNAGIWMGGVVDGESVAVGAVDRCNYGSGFTNIVNLTQLAFPDAQRFYTVYYESSAGVEVEQNSYAFSYYSIYKDFIIFDYKIYNQSAKTYEQVYLGLYFNGIAYSGTAPPLLQEICGTKAIVGTTNDTGIVGWVADNDGNPDNGSFTNNSVTSVVGAIILYPRVSDCQTSFNWWAGAWGPTLQSNFANFGLFADSGIGSPGTCREKYYLMSNSEIDYDQNTTHLDHSLQGWLAPPANALGYADGAPSFFLLSCGPVGNLYPNDTLRFSFAIIGGESFHTDPLGYDSANPQLAVYDLSTLVSNAQIAQSLYDSLFNPPTDVKTEPLPIPNLFHLGQNYPNPFNAGTRIDFTLAKQSEVRIEIYNLLGQIVKLINLGPQLPGQKSIVWDGRGADGKAVSSGVYFYRLKAADFVQSRKMILLK